MSGRGGDGFRGRGRGKGRGAHYKEKYGGRGRGSGANGHSRSSSPPAAESMDVDFDNSTVQKTWSELSATIQSIDGSQFGAYKRLQGEQYHHGDNFILKFDRVQSDPYAQPTRVRVIMPVAATGFPSEFLEIKISQIALCDYLTRSAADFIRKQAMHKEMSGSGWSGPKGGAFNINAPGQEVLQRSSCVFSPAHKTIELRFTLSLPASGRTILGREAHRILVDKLPVLVHQTLRYESHDASSLYNHHTTVLRQENLRAQLGGLGLISFIANGSMLPRQSGAATLPMLGSHVIPFISPPELEVEILGSKGMGIRKGVTVLSGGGFHGKSTLLEAVQFGIYNHIPGDGREKVVTDPTAFKIRAEDGRSVTSLDISPFISTLPGDRSCKTFCSEDSSGSTSMASNIQEALELGCKALLIDEDSSATNLLVRDQRMQKLIKTEPITPFVSKARALYTQHAVSTLIVVGGCGDYLSVADTVIGMDNYTAIDLTKRAQNIVKELPTNIQVASQYGPIPNRSIEISKEVIGLKSPNTRGKEFLRLFTEKPPPVRNPAEAESGIDISQIEQIVEHGQARLIAEILFSFSGKSGELNVLLDEFFEAMQTSAGLDVASAESRAYGDLVVTRKLEIGAALNRLRGLEVR